MLPARKVHSTSVPVAQQCRACIPKLLGAATKISHMISSNCVLQSCCAAHSKSFSAMKSQVTFCHELPSQSCQKLVSSLCTPFPCRVPPSHIISCSCILLPGLAIIVKLKPLPSHCSDTNYSLSWNKMGDSELEIEVIDKVCGDLSVEKHSM